MQIHILRALVLMLVLGLLSSTACIVRTSPGHSHHRSTHHDNGKHKGEKKHKKNKKHDKRKH